MSTRSQPSTLRITVASALLAILLSSSGCASGTNQSTAEYFNNHNLTLRQR